MGKLDDALQARTDARARLMVARKELVSALKAADAVSAQVEAATNAERSAQRDLITAVRELHPLLDADVAGIVGSKRQLSDVGEINLTMGFTDTAAAEQVADAK